MKTLKELKIQLNKDICQNCNSVSEKLIAPSITKSKVYYCTCKKCGYVSIAKTSIKKDELKYKVKATSNKETIFNKISNKLTIEDAIESYKAIGLGVDKVCMTPDEAEEYTKKASMLLEDEYKDYEEDYEIDYIDNYSSAISLDESYYDSTVEKYVVITNKDKAITYDVKNFLELRDAIETDFGTEKVTIYKIDCEVSVNS